MEQTKNEPKNENKAAPDNGKPKKERKLFIAATPSNSLRLLSFQTLTTELFGQI